MIPGQYLLLCTRHRHGKAAPPLWIAMTALKLPDGVVALLNAYVHPALLLLREQFALDAENLAESLP